MRYQLFRRGGTTRRDLSSARETRSFRPGINDQAWSGTVKASWKSPESWSAEVMLRLSSPHLHSLISPSQFSRFLDWAPRQLDTTWRPFLGYLQCWKQVSPSASAAPLETGLSDLTNCAHSSRAHPRSRPVRREQSKLGPRLYFANI